VASRWPQRLALAASISLSISRSVRYRAGGSNCYIYYLGSTLLDMRIFHDFCHSLADDCYDTIRSVTVSPPEVGASILWATPPQKGVHTGGAVPDGPDTAAPRKMRLARELRGRELISAPARAAPPLPPTA